MIRGATDADMPALLALGRQMHAEGHFRHVVLDEDKVQDTLEELAANHFLAVNDGPDGIDGVLGGALTELWFSREKVAADFVLFVRPSRRGSIAALRLVQSFVAWARERGAAEVSISQSSGVRIEETNRLLTGMGFAYVGGVYKWRLGNV